MDRSSRVLYGEDMLPAEAPGCELGYDSRELRPVVLAVMKVVGEHAPARGLPVKHPLMHRTRTVDYAIIMAGEIDMMLDDALRRGNAGF